MITVIATINHGTLQVTYNGITRSTECAPNGTLKGPTMFMTLIYIAAAIHAVFLLWLAVEAIKEAFNI